MANFCTTHKVWRYLGFHCDESEKFQNWLYVSLKKFFQKSMHQKISEDSLNDLTRRKNTYPKINIDTIYVHQSFNLKHALKQVTKQFDIQWWRKTVLSSTKGRLHVYKKNKYIIENHILFAILYQIENGIWRSSWKYTAQNN